MHASTVSAPSPVNPIRPRPSDEDGGFDHLLTAMRRHFGTVGSAPLFRVAAEGLYAAFLDNLPPALRQHYTCNCCRHFVERWGALVTVDEQGRTVPAVWPDSGAVPDVFREPISAMRRLIKKAEIAGVFLTAESVLGSPITGEWTHMALTIPESRRHRDIVKTAGQTAAERGQDLETLKRGLDEFSADAVRKAQVYLTTGGLYRSEKAEGAVKWLLALHEMRAATKNERARENLLWVAAATAPAGFCHVKSGMVGTLLEDITAGLPLETVKTRWAEKMHPLQYQRPQAPPSAGNLARAEAVVSKLQSAGALSRRFAKLSDVQDITWQPVKPKEAAPPKAGAVFGHITPKAQKGTGDPLDMPSQTMTWEKFRRTVLPDAVAIEFYVPHRAMNYTALVTAADPEAPPILQWDRDDKRNPVSLYVYNGGSMGPHWNLTPGAWCPVTTITPSPHAWNGGHYPHHGEQVIVLLEGCRDTRHRQSGGFFPETLRSEYHEIRSAMEAYAQRATIAGRDEPDLACGLALSKSQSWSDVRLRVTSKNGVRLICSLDRWD